MELTKNKLIELLRIMEEGTACQVKKQTGPSAGRIYQIWSGRKRAGNIPELGFARANGRNDVKKKISCFR